MYIFYMPKCWYVNYCLILTMASFRWLIGIDGSPGFSHQAIEELKQKRQGPHGSLYRHCCLILDAMAIRKNVEYDPRTSQYIGFTSLGSEFGIDDDRLATEALVFMAVGITGSWKCPVAYFLTNGVSATIQSQLVTHAIELLEEAGVEVKALTLDGHKTNISMLRKCGCSFKPDNPVSTFQGPTGSDIHTFIDPCHCLKLVRNIFAKLKSIDVPGIGTASWNHIVQLHSLQEREQLTAANKLSSRHIRFEQQKMKVGFKSFYFFVLIPTFLIGLIHIIADNKLLLL